MSVTAIHPYLMLNGTAENAIALYQTALGAKVSALSRFGDVKDMPVADADKNRVMHAVLKIGAAELMISDSMPGRSPVSGSKVKVSLNYSDAAEMARAFEAMAVGGQVDFPLHDTFWGAKFGMLTDTHGIQWMFNCEVKKS